MIAFKIEEIAIKILFLPFYLGIGRALAKQLSKHGATVFALSKSKQNLESLKEEIEGIQILTVDLCDWEATRKAVESVGHIDLLVNNAGVAVLQSFMTITPDSFDRCAQIQDFNKAF